MMKSLRVFLIIYCVCVCLCVNVGGGGVPPQPSCDQTWTRWCCGASTHAWLCWHGGASAYPVKCGRSSCHPPTPAPEKPHQTILWVEGGRCAEERDKLHVEGFPPTATQSRRSL